MRNKFGTEFSVGNNLELLARLARYFKEERRSAIIRYYCCVDNNSRSKRYLRHQDLHECEICKTKLYTEDKGDGSFLDDDTIKTVTEKKHMVLIDSYSHSHYTCYGVNWCFGRVGYEVPEVTDEEMVQIIPTFEQLLDVNILSGDKKVRDLFLKIEKQVYSDVVELFLRNWMHNSINKDNLSKFLKDLSRLRIKFVSYFDRDAAAVFENNLFKVLGITK